MSSASFGTVNATSMNVTGIVQASQIITTRPMQVSDLTITGAIQRQAVPLTVEAVETYATCLKLRWTLPDGTNDIQGYRLYIWEDGEPVTGLGVGARDYLLIDRTTIGPSKINQATSALLNSSFLDDLDLISHVYNVEMYNGSVSSKEVTSRVLNVETTTSQIFEMYLYLYQYSTVDTALNPLALLPETPYQFQVIAVSTGGDLMFGPRSGDITTAALRDWETSNALSYGNLPLRSHSTPYDTVAHAITENENDNANMIKLTNDTEADWKISFKNSVYGFDLNGSEAATDYDDSTWNNIALPSCFEYTRYGEESYGKPTYLCHEAMYLPLLSHVMGLRGLVFEDLSLDNAGPQVDIGQGIMAERISQPRKLKFVDYSKQPDHLVTNMQDQNPAQWLPPRGPSPLFGDRNKLGLVPFPQHNPCGMVRKHFTVPSGWTGKRIIISIEAAKSNFYLYINGVKVGWATAASKSMHEFDITAHVSTGDNVVALKVIKYSTAITLYEDHDAWRVVGITRDINIYAVDTRVSINDCYINIPSSNIVLGVNNQASSANIIPEISFLANGSQSANVAFYLNEWGTTSEGSLTLIGSQTVTPSSNANAAITFNPITVTNKKLWSAETPNLYQVVVKVSTSAGALLDTRMFQIGFRKLEWSIFDPANPGDYFPGLRLNGKNIKIKGINKHEFDPNSQNYEPRAAYYNDVSTLKQFNFNTIRTSHYPNSKYSYRSANELGMHVISECDVGNDGRMILGGSATASSHSTGVDYDPHFLPALIDRTRRCVIEHRNNPSIIMNSLENESGRGDNYVAMYRHIRDNHLSDNVPVVLGDYVNVGQVPDNSAAPGQGGFNSQYSRVLPLKYLIAGDTNTSNLVPNETRGCDFATTTYCRPTPTAPTSDPLGAFSLVRFSQIYDTYMQSFFNYEYCHMMGNSGGYLEYFWTDGPKIDIESAHMPEYSIRGNPRYMGGCVWDYRDQSLWVDSKNVPGLKWIRGYGGDWDEKITDGGFCQNGLFNCNGSPTPAAYDFKHIQCPFRATLGYVNDGASGYLGHANVVIFNENQFVNANTLVDVKWSLLKNGVELDTGFLSNNIAANTASSIQTVDFTSVADNGSDEFHFNVSFPDVNGVIDPYRNADRFLKPYTYFDGEGVQYLNSNIGDYLNYESTSNIVVERGFEEISLFEDRKYEITNPLSTVSAYDVQNKGRLYVITSTGIASDEAGYFKMELNKKNAIVETLTTGGTVIKKLGPDFYNRLSQNQIAFLSFSTVLLNEPKWRDVFEKNQPMPPTIDIVSNVNGCFITIDTAIELDVPESDPSFGFAYSGNQNVVPPVFKKVWTFPITLKYTILPNRSVQVDFTVSRDDGGNTRDQYFGSYSMSPRFVCVGMNFLKATSTATASPMTVFGKGPLSTMKDRNTGHSTAVYTGTVKNFQYDYTLTEPSGIHVNTRFANVSTLTISSNLVTQDSSPTDTGMIISVNDYLPAQQDDYRHNEEIPRIGGYLVVKVIADQTGSGGYNSWLPDNIAYGVSDVQGMEYNLKFNLFDSTADQVPSMV